MIMSLVGRRGYLGMLIEHCLVRLQAREKPDVLEIWRTMTKSPRATMLRAMMRRTARKTKGKMARMKMGRAAVRVTKKTSCGTE